MATSYSIIPGPSSTRPGPDSPSFSVEGSSTVAGAAASSSWHITSEWPDFALQQRLDLQEQWDENGEAACPQNYRPFSKWCREGLYEPVLIVYHIEWDNETGLPYKGSVSSIFNCFASACGKGACYWKELNSILRPNLIYRFHVIAETPKQVSQIPMFLCVKSGAGSCVRSPRNGVPQYMGYRLPRKTYLKPFAYSDTFSFHHANLLCRYWFGLSR